MTICILGRQPKLGLAELEARFGSDAVAPLGREAATVESEIAPALHRVLGGAIKVAQKLGDVPSTDWRDIFQTIRQLLPGLVEGMPVDGKIKLGLSAYDVPVGTKVLQAAGLELKKQLRKTGRSVRIIPNTEAVLGSAQVLHNQLTSPLGIELLCIRDGTKTVIARTTSVQNIDDYSQRDFGRPKRDAFVGMLPPKLAQIMINLAAPAENTRLLDPFCGTGVVLQEAALMGHAIYGTDLQEKMVRYTRDNIAWLEETYRIKVDKFFEIADATDHAWQQPLGVVVCETYLGQPLSALPSPEKLNEIVQNCETIIRKFLRNLHKQLAPGTRICIAVPAWNTGKAFKQLPLVDHLREIGYNRVSFAHAGNEDLRHFRIDQIVARQLLVLTRK